MMTDVRLELLSSASLVRPTVVVRKVFDRPEQLGHEARWLTRARNLGAARLLDVRAADQSLATAFAGGQTLASVLGRALVPLEQNGSAAKATDNLAAARLLIADLVRIIAALHHKGLGHGKLTADHVVVGQRGSVVLVSPGTPDSGSIDLVRQDMVALARLLNQLADLSATAGQHRHHQSWRQLARRLIDEHELGAGRLWSHVRSEPWSLEWKTRGAGIRRQRGRR